MRSPEQLLIMLSIEFVCVVYHNLWSHIYLLHKRIITPPYMSTDC